MDLLTIDVWEKENSRSGYPDYHIVIEEGSSYKLMEFIDAINRIGRALEEKKK